jgi:hypothetical protein
MSNKEENPHDEELFVWSSEGISDRDRDEAIKLILDHLNMTIVKTWHTKHGDAQLFLQKRDNYEQ